MTAEAGRFEGQDRFECREAVVTALEEEGFLRRIEPHAHSIGHCYRCKTVVEPNLSKQWFVKVAPLAEKAINAVETGNTRIIPTMWTNTYYDWMYNIKDWCISRQIWWGHQIPAWTCAQCNEITVAMENPQSCPRCQSDDLVQETDVLDTWFSSALWPFSTMGWPSETPLLEKYYPTSVLVTGFDILFFWVARMMMMGLHFKKDVPFKDVYVHALVRDEHGKKMSKSKGNVIDPLTIIDKYGTDAFRFTLAAFAAQGRDIKMSEKRVEGYRHFVNKLWNAARFSLMHLDDTIRPIDDQTLALPDQWILSRLLQVSQETASALDDYRFNDAAKVLYQFVWHEFCDWYLELIKPALYGKDDPERKEATLAVLGCVLKETLILLHPLIPFVTEEIWHKLPQNRSSIMTATFPLDNGASLEPFHNPLAEHHMNQLIDIITAIRNIRGEMNIGPSVELTLHVQSDDPETVTNLKTHFDLVTNISRLNQLSVEAPGERPRASATAIIANANLFIPLEGVIDFAQEQQRLEKEIGKLDKELSSVSKKLANPNFLEKAPADVVKKVKVKSADLLHKQEALRANLEKIASLVG